MKVIKYLLIFLLICSLSFHLINYIQHRIEISNAKAMWHEEMERSREEKLKYKEMGYELDSASKMDLSDILLLDNTLLDAKGFEDFILQYSGYPLSFFIEIPNIIESEEHHIWYLDNGSSNILNNSIGYSKIYLNNGLILDEESKIMYDKESSRYILDGHYKLFFDMDVYLKLRCSKYDLIKSENSYMVHLVWSYDEVVGVIFEIMG